jgi:hypothetical protein
MKWILKKGSGKSWAIIDGVSSVHADLVFKSDTLESAIQYAETLFVDSNLIGIDDRRLFSNRGRRENSDKDISIVYYHCSMFRKISKFIQRKTEVEDIKSYTALLIDDGKIIDIMECFYKVNYHIDQNDKRFFLRHQGQCVLIYDSNLENCPPPISEIYGEKIRVVIGSEGTWANDCEDNRSKFEINMEFFEPSLTRDVIEYAKSQAFPVEEKFIDYLHKMMPVVENGTTGVDWQDHINIPEFVAKILGVCYQERRGLEQMAAVVDAAKEVLPDCDPMFATTENLRQALSNLED